MRHVAPLIGVFASMIATMGHAKNFIICGALDPLCTIEGSAIHNLRLNFSDLCKPEVRKALGPERAFLIPDVSEHCSAIGNLARDNRIGDQDPAALGTIVGVTWRMDGQLRFINRNIWETIDETGAYYIVRYSWAPVPGLMPVGLITPISAPPSASSK